MKRLVFVFFGSISVALAAGYLYPQYELYKSRLESKAEISRARYRRQVEEQDAISQSIRTQSIVDSNKSIGDSLRNNPEALQYLYITTLGKANVVYVPTEGGMPVMPGASKK